MSWWANWTQLLIVVDAEGHPVNRDVNGRYRIGSYADVFYTDDKAEECATVAECETGVPVEVVHIMLPPDSDAVPILDRLTKCSGRTLGWVVLDSDCTPLASPDGGESAKVFLLDTDLNDEVTQCYSGARVVSINLPEKYLAAIAKKSGKPTHAMTKRVTQLRIENQ